MKNRSAPPLTALASVFACVVGLMACGEKAAEPGTGTPEGQSEQAGEASGGAPDAGQLYAVHCALCHGVTGDGKGLVPLDRPARSFIKGAFSFGNTPEALYRTISNGIGGTPMPGFKEFLSEQQRRELAQYVIDLGPEQAPQVPGASEMHVTDTPLVVRGGLPPISDGLAPVTRGLLVGGLDGLTFEYNTKPLALLGVRQGAFVDRKDWQGRGGAQLQPLGVVSHVVDPGSHTFMWMETGDQGGAVPLQARLRATSIEGGQAWVEYELPEHGGAVIRERGEAISLAGWPGFRRTLEARGKDAFAGLKMSQLAGKQVTQVSSGPKGVLLQRTIEGELPTYFLVHAPFGISVAGKGPEEALTELKVDTLYGLKPTEENLKGLKELVQ